MSNNTYPFPGGGNPGDDFKRVYDKNKTLFNIAAVVAVFAFLGWVSFYQIEPEEAGVLTTFGKFSELTDPGPHFRIPLIQEVSVVPNKRQLKMEFGFSTITSGVRTEYSRGPASLRESMMLTGDLNVAIVEWIVHYTIADPYKYLFKVRNVDQNTRKNTLRALSEATMREVVGDYSVTEVLTKGREEILQNAKEKLAKLCETYETGLTIQRIELKNSAPPLPVTPSFNEVNQAEQERDRMQNDAWAQYNKEIPKARGQARQLVQEAEGYAVERVNKAKGDVAWFQDLQKEYARAPKVTRTRLYIETMNEVLPNVGKKIFIDDGAKNGVIPMLFPMGGVAAGGAR